jgi:hypothetical protein
MFLDYRHILFGDQWVAPVLHRRAVAATPPLFEGTEKAPPASFQARQARSARDERLWL